MQLGLLSLLTVLFTGLKLANVITWSWWWVLSPTWVPAVAGLVVLLIMLVVHKR